MATQQTFAKRDPSASAGAIATAAATTAGLVLVFCVVYTLVVVMFVLPNFERFNVNGARDQMEILRRKAEADTVSDGFLLVSPVLAGGHTMVVMASPDPLHAPFAGTWSLLLFVVTVILSLPFAVLAYVRQQALRLGWPLPWAIFVLLFGPLGWMAYRVHRRWPPVSRCEQCGSSAPQHLADCLVCGEGFLPPAPNGTEVFA